MIGVVLWSDAKDGKAVFWCEDQGDLAYYETSADEMLGLGAFDAGDMVQFDVSTDQRLRRASNAILVKEQAYSGLPEKLRQNGNGPAKTSPGAKVIPFRVTRCSEVGTMVKEKRKA